MIKDNPVKEKLKGKADKFKEKVKDRKEKFKQKFLHPFNKKDILTKRSPAVYEMLVTIVNRGKGEKVLDFLKLKGIEHHIVTFGAGTAPTNLASLLSLYNKEKEVLFAIIKLKDSTKILDDLEKNILLSEKYAGIAFTIPLKSMTNLSIELIDGEQT